MLRAGSYVEMNLKAQAATWTSEIFTVDTLQAEDNLVKLAVDAHIAEDNF